MGRAPGGSDVGRDLEGGGVPAEVLARAESNTQTRKPANASRQVDAKKPFHEFIVDVWITNFNSVEFGIFKRDRNKAKSLIGAAR